MNNAIEKRDSPQADALLRQRAHEWRLLLESAEADEQDHRDFETWLAADERNPQAFARASSVWDALGFVGEEQWDSRLRFEAVQPHQGAAIGGENRIWSQVSDWLLRPGWAFALAAIVLGVGLIWIPQAERVPASVAVDLETLVVETYSSNVSKTRQIRLSDGSEITLGAASEIKVQMGVGKRRVHLLNGAALFDVVSDPERPFVVNAGELTAQALGTVFDVRLNGGVARVSVAEGAVVVRYASSDLAGSNTPAEETLEAGQQVVADTYTGLSEVYPTERTSVGAWKASRLIYLGATLEELIADANRYGAQSILLGDLDPQTLRMKITGSFDIGDVDALLASLPDIFPVEVQLDSDVRDGASDSGLASVAPAANAVVIQQRVQEGGKSPQK
ncbi:MAG: FecR domain-containing protein [Pseudomonadota bacterium]